MKKFASVMLLSSAFVEAEPPQLKTTFLMNRGKKLRHKLDANKSFSEICIENGFQFETHSVTTEDGYNLSVFRIPGLKKEGYISGGNKPPILFQHGCFDSADAWIMNYADVTPAFVAARAGYDVWLGNSRGNTYSRSHITFDPDHDQKLFWDFTFYEMGLYDLPATIEMIQEKTNGQKVAYIGHSQGATSMFSALAENEAYFEDKVSLFVALGPVTKMSHTKGVVFNFAALFYDQIVDAVETFGIHEVLQNSWNVFRMSSMICRHVEIYCDIASSIFVNSDPKLDDITSYAVYMNHGPNGTSAKSLLHYAQNLKENRFQMYSNDYADFFSEYNKKTDRFHIEKIQTVPVAMIQGIEDILAHKTDSEWTRNQIGSVVHYEEIHAGHLSFLIGKDMSYFSGSVMNLLQEYHPVPLATPDINKVSNQIGAPKVDISDFQMVYLQ